LGALFAMLPTFRTDLSATSIPQDGVEGFDVVDPTTAEIYRFSPSEMFVAQRLNGRRTQAEILADLQRQPGLSMGPEEFTNFVEQLRAMGLTRAVEQQQTEIHLDMAALVPQPAPAAGGRADPPPQSATSAAAWPGPPTQGVPGAKERADPPFQGATSAGAWPGPSTQSAPAAGGRATPPSRGASSAAAQPSASRQTAPQDPASQAQAHIAEGLDAVHSGQLTRALQCLSRARTLIPNDAKLLRLGRAIKKAGPQAAGEQVERLWQLCAELYPQEVSRLNRGLALPPEPRPGLAWSAEATVAESAEARAHLLVPPPSSMSAAQLWRRLATLRAPRASLWLTAAALLLVLGSAGYALRHRGGGRSLLGRMLHRPVAVRLQALQAGRMPVYYPGGAKLLQLRGEQWLSFTAAGRVTKPLPAVGLRVQAGDVLARLDLTAVQGRTLTAAQAARAAQEAEQARLSRYLNTLLEERSRVEATVESVQSAAGRGSRAEAAVASRLQRLRKQLRGVAQRERAGRAKLARAIDRTDAAQAVWRRVVQRLHRQLLLAPGTGEVTEVRLQAGEKVAAGDPAVLLRDRAQLQLTFAVPPGDTFERGQAVWVSVQQATPQAASVAHVEQGEKITEVQVEMPLEPDAADTAAAGAPAAGPAAEFRLVKTFVQPAYQVSPLAIVGDPQQPQVLLLQGGRVRRLSIKILEAHSGALFIGGLPEDLEPSPHLIIGRLDAQPLGALLDGAQITASSQR
jgi:multidrug efflux pump subunit AcrA (membrane-fusion protein)